MAEKKLPEKIDLSSKEVQTRIQDEIKQYLEEIRASVDLYPEPESMEPSGQAFQETRKFSTPEKQISLKKYSHLERLVKSLVVDIVRQGGGRQSYMPREIEQVLSGLKSYYKESKQLTTEGTFDVNLVSPIGFNDSVRVIKEFLKSQYGIVAQTTFSQQLRQVLRYVTGGFETDSGPGWRGGKNPIVTSTLQEIPFLKELPNGLFILKLLRSKEDKQSDFFPYSFSSTIVDASDILQVYEKYMDIKPGAVRTLPEQMQHIEDMRVKRNNLFETGTRIEQSTGGGTALRHPTYKSYVAEIDQLAKQSNVSRKQWIDELKLAKNNSEFLKERIKEINEYVEEPVKPLMQEVYDMGGSPYGSNAYGPGRKGVRYTDKSGKDQFLALKTKPEINMKGTGTVRSMIDPSQQTKPLETQEQRDIFRHLVYEYSTEADRRKQRQEIHDPDHDPVLLERIAEKAKERRTVTFQPDTQPEQVEEELKRIPVSIKPKTKPKPSVPVEFEDLEKPTRTGKYKGVRPAIAPKSAEEMQRINDKLLQRKKQLEQRPKPPDPKGGPKGGGTGGIPLVIPDVIFEIFFPKEPTKASLEDQMTKLTG